jgi:ABC-2 type transport system permease protein
MSNAFGEVCMIAKYWKTALMAATGYIGDSPLFLMDYLIRLLRVLVLLALWRMILADQGQYGGLTLATVLTYTLIAEVFAPQLAPHTNLEGAFWEGTIVGRMLQPLHIFGQFSAETAGKWFFEWAVFSIPLLLAAPLLGVQPFPADLAAGGLFLLSLGLAIAVGLALDFCFGALLILLQLPFWTFAQIRMALTSLLSGALIPLALLPPAVAGVFAWLPFASMASAPLQIYVGTGNHWRLLVIQVVWVIVLWPLASWLWAIARERMVAYGG